MAGRPENGIRATDYGQTGKEVNAEIGSYSTNIILKHPGQEAWVLFLNICCVNDE